MVVPKILSLKPLNEPLYEFKPVEKMKFLRKPATIIILAGLSFAGLSFGEKYHQILDNDMFQNRLLSIGDKAPDISLPDPDGNTRKLSDLRGKIVLVDFWASWCRPCRVENPNLVKTYQKFNGANFKNAKGFEIYSVSLDRSKADWERAIKADKLTWENHVSDLKFWKSQAAALYNVNAIPATYLVDAEGVIIAKDLRGGALDRTLEKLAQ